jgi:hypothetical protein
MEHLGVNHENDGFVSLEDGPLKQGGARTIFEFELCTTLNSCIYLSAAFLSGIDSINKV